MNLTPPPERSNPDLIEAEAYELLAKAKRLRAEQAPRSHGDDELLTLEAAGEFVNKTPRALRDAGRRGDLEVFIVGRSPRVRRSALLAWARPVAAESIVSANDGRAEARASIANAAARIGGAR